MEVGRAASAREQRRAWREPRIGRLPQLALGVARSFLADDGITWSAATAFYLVLSIPPLLIGVGALTHLAVGRDDIVAAFLTQPTRLIPGEGNAVRDLAVTRGRDVAVAGLLALGWILVSGSRIFGVLTASIEGMWDVPRKGTLVERELLRFGLLAGAILILSLGCLLAAVAGELGPTASPAAWLGWLLAAQIVPVLLVVAALVLLYRTVPPGKAGSRAAVAGAIVSATLLRLIQFAFMEVFQASTGWQTVYGPLAGVALLMSWALACAACVILGAEVVILAERPERLEEVGVGKPGEENRRPDDRRAAVSD